MSVETKFGNDEKIPVAFLMVLQTQQQYLSANYKPEEVDPKQWNIKHGKEILTGALNCHRNSDVLWAINQGMMPEEMVNAYHKAQTIPELRVIEMMCIQSLNNHSWSEIDPFHWIIKQNGPNTQTPIYMPQPGACEGEFATMGGPASGLEPIQVSS